MNKLYFNMEKNITPIWYSNTSWDQQELKIKINYICNMSKEKIKEKHIIPKGMNLNQNDFVYNFVKDDALTAVSSALPGSTSFDHS